MPGSSRFRVTAARQFGQFARFACVGISNTLLSYLVYAALVSGGLHYVLAGAVGFAAGAVNGYRLNRRWTFRAPDSTARRIRYAAVQLGSLGVTTLLLWLIVSVGGVHRLAGYLLTIPVVTGAAFAANRAWTFGNARLFTGTSQARRSGLRSLGGLLRGNRRKERTMLRELQTDNGTAWRILVVANETVTSAVLHEAVALRAKNLSAEVLVVAPALNRRLHHWASDEDGARQAALERLRACLRQLSGAGIAANGYVGDSDPLLAIADALRLFPADEIIVATHPEERSNWLARHLVARARVRFHQPVLHVVVDGTTGTGRPFGACEGPRVATAA